MQRLFASWAGVSINQPRVTSPGPLAAVMLGVAMVTMLNTAKADTAYSNLTNYTGSAYVGGGAAAINGTMYTALVADDITPAAAFAGRAVTGFSYTVANLNTATVSASAIVSFYSSSGTGGGPGTELASFAFSPTLYGAGVQTFTFDQGTSLFTLPGAGDFFWAGVVFSNSGTTTTTAQLNNLGQAIYAPPTVGSSQDAFFKSDAANNGQTSNPSGGFLYFGGTPPADFGFQFTTASPAVVPTPEPSSVSLVLTGVGAVAETIRRRRRRG